MPFLPNFTHFWNSTVLICVLYKRAACLLSKKWWVCTVQVTCISQPTAARIRSSQRVRSNKKGLDRLKGVVPVIEDWHSKRILLTIICVIMLTLLLMHVPYKCSNRKQTLGWLLIMQCIHLLIVQAIWKQLYNCSSASDVGSLYHLSNTINQRNIVI